MKNRRNCQEQRPGKSLKISLLNTITQAAFRYFKLTMKSKSSDPSNSQANVQMASNKISKRIF